MATDESFVPVTSDGTTRDIRNLKLLGVVQADGTTTADVYVQCVAITDVDGKPVSLDATNELLRSLLREMQTLRIMYGRATGQHMIALNGAMGDEALAG